MNTSTTVITTLVVTAAGRWASDQPLDIKFAIGAGFFAIAMSILSGFNDAIAGPFALLVLLAACFKYLPNLLTKFGQ